MAKDPWYVCGWVCCAGKRRKKQTGAELEWFVLVGSKRQYMAKASDLNI